ncbi:MAG TPA: hypothetical protein VNG29_03250 [Candidatus Paceibacterota bacterium]|nr:hypothetical protein [Candidatus Paceibacterota bacterium]
MIMGSNFKRDLMISAAIFAGAVLAISASLYFFANDLTAKVSSISADRVLIAERATAVGSLADLEKGVAQAKGYQAAMDQLLVPYDQLIAFPQWLDGLATAHKVALSFSSDKTLSGTSGALPAYNGFSMSVTGNLNDDIGFVRDVESNAPRFLVSFTNFDVTHEGAQYKISLAGQVYFKQ